MNVASTSLAGMTQALSRFDRASSDLLRSVTDGSQTSPEEAAVELFLAETQFTASLAALKAADDMCGALLDIRV